MSTTITLPTDLTAKAQIVLDWDNGQWYISNIVNQEQAEGGTQVTTQSSATAGVKVPEWDNTYKYGIDDIVAYKGVMYVAKQNANQDNIPNSGTFWWKPLIDLSSVDSITVEGRNMTEIARDILGGNSISDFYKKTEVDNIILTYFNNVNAKKLSDWTLAQIQNDYTTKISETGDNAELYVKTYLADDSQNSLQQQMVDIFNAQIAPDNVNRL